MRTHAGGRHGECSTGDIRFEATYRRLRDTGDPSAALRSLSDDDVVAALTVVVSREEPYLANILATEAMNRLQRARTILAHLGEGVVGLDEGGRVTYLNAAAEERIGWTAEGIYRQPFCATVHAPGEPPEAHAPHCPIHACMRARTTKRVEAAEPFVRADGRAFPAAYAAAPILREGELVGVAIVFRDVTERERLEAERQAAERALRDSELRFRALVEAAWEAIIVHADGRLVDANPAAFRMFGFEDPQEVIGRPVTDFVDRASLPTVAEAIRSGRKEPYRATLIARDGTRIPVRIAGRDVRYVNRPARVAVIRREDE